MDHIPPPSVGMQELASCNTFNNNIILQTPLHLAAREGYPRCIQTLLDHGASLDKRTTDMETVESLVKGKPTCEKIFRQAVARYRMPQRSAEQRQNAESKYQKKGRCLLWS